MAISNSVYVILYPKHIVLENDDKFHQVGGAFWGSFYTESLVIQSNTKVLHYKYLLHVTRHELYHIEHCWWRQKVICCSLSDFPCAVAINGLVELNGTSG